MWYACKELRRRPKHTLSFLLIVCAILVSLALLLLYMEAEWRADVMPDHEENYHFALRDLSDSDKEAIKKYEWVQAWYDIEPDAPEGSKASLSYKSEFRVRVTWDHVYQAGECARIAMDDLGIFRKAPYSSHYDSYYNEALGLFHTHAKGS